MKTTTSQLEKLKAVLNEVFMLDRADLDFGIYRIMNIKRDEIQTFLDRDLLPQVQAAFAKYQPASQAQTQRELDETIASAKAAGFDPEASPKVKTLREKLNQAVDLSAMEADVYNHLASFFHRYYKDGDFLSLRRYKEGVYAIPYEGEEVKLHWANADQYYIKSSEHLTNYAFKLPSNENAPAPQAGQRVRFELVAGSTARDNVKDTDRFFYLHENEPVAEEGVADSSAAQNNKELVIRFEYRTHSGTKPKQEKLNAESVEAALAAAPEAWQPALSHPAPTPAKPNRTLLEKHIATFTARYTFDYFIHKDLEGFLRRELDFYIKNEVLHLDDLDQMDDGFDQINQSLSRVRVLRQIAHKIIQFLGQFEEFQKKLWLKKKFVLETNWCITLDRIPEEFYPEIAANDAQREEWVKLFAIDEIAESTVGPGYSVPLTVEFLKANPLLVLDTHFFSRVFCEKVIGSINNIEHDSSGLLLEADNFHALNFLLKRYSNDVRCIYIDPPYNTGSDGFIYKDSYRHSSWLSLLHNRLRIAHILLSEKGSLFVSIDDNEYPRLNLLLSDLFDSDNEIATVIWQKVFSPKNTAKYFSDDHEYITTWAKDKATWRPTLLPRSTEANDRYTNPDDDPRGPWSSSDLTARNFYSQGQYEVTGPTGRIFEPVIGTYWRVNFEQFGNLNSDGRIWWGEDGNNMPRMKRFLSEVKQGIVPQTLWTHGEVGHTQDAKRQLISTVVFDRTIDVLNTVKPVPLLKRVVHIGTDSDNHDVVLDFFAGSGSTGQAVLSQNAEDSGNRKFVLVEMSDYFESITKQRIKRSMHATEWRNSKPTKVAENGCLVKYLRLESYQDTLENLNLSSSSLQESFLGRSANPEMREDYMLGYMLDAESQGSPSLLNVDRFTDPFNYTLQVTRDDEKRTVTVDLVETFNYLIGLRVEQMDARIHRTADFARDEHGRLTMVDGRTRPCEEGEGWTFRVIQGRSPSDEKVIIIWRTLTGHAEEDNAMLDALFTKLDINTRDREFDIIYVNGDNNLENLRRPDESWKVRLVEADFHRLMWEVEDV